MRISWQSLDIAGGVHVGQDDLDVGAGDQGIMFGYASDETEDAMPLTHSMATRLGKKLTDVRKNGDLWCLRPDGKTQVTIEHVQRDDGSVEPRKIHTVVRAVEGGSKQGGLEYYVPQETALSMAENDQVDCREGDQEDTRRNCLQRDAGLSGHRIIIDTYGGWGGHGGSAFSGKDHTIGSLEKNGLSKR